MTDVVDRRTARLHLRSLTTADAPVVAALQSDPRTNAHRPGGPPSHEESEQAVHEFVRGWQEDGIGYWVVELDAKVVGVAGVRPLQFRGRTCWNLYYRFAPEVWGMGLAGAVLEPKRATSFCGPEPIGTRSSLRAPACLQPRRR